ncbi:MAG: AzlC family ABC transporter permease [Actinomycetota bacterium]
MPSTDTGAMRRILTTSLPAAAAIAVFGTLYGAAAQPILGTPTTIASSMFIFSGALQFALVGLLSAGAGAPALLLTAGTLNLRHVVMGAVLRPRIGGSRLRRAGLAFTLLDETFGFAIAAPEETGAERTLFVSGVFCYLAWQAGTVIGVLGAGLSGVEGLADAIFPVLFIGLAALAATSGTLVLRALAAVALTAAVAVWLPDVRSLAPVIAGALVALPGDSQSPHPPDGRSSA